MKRPKNARRNAFALDKELTHTVGEARSLREEGLTDVENLNYYTTQTGTPLPKDLVNAFKEVFDLFDSNGGGTIDAEELDLALRSVDVQLSQEEIIEVLTSMDRDGNGEIDFDEFLNLMTNTERFLEGLSPGSDNSYCLKTTDSKIRRRETLLFEALTNFMKKSALQSIDQIVGYYHTKYKRTQAPHVVGHYAAGARLIGLTEFQLRKHMETLRKHHAKGHENSPYAEPLHIVFEHIPKRKKKKDLPPRGRIRLRFNTTRFCNNGLVIRAQSMPPTKVPEMELQSRGKSLPVPILLPRRQKEEQQVKQLPEKPQGTAWRSQRIKPFPVELPVKCGRLSNLPGRLNAKVLSFDFLPAIRDKVSKAKEDFWGRLLDQKRKESEQHWKALQTKNIQSDALRKKFRMSFNAYNQFLKVDCSRTQSADPQTETKQVRPYSEVQRKREDSIQYNEIRSLSTS